MEIKTVNWGKQKVSSMGMLDVFDGTNLTKDVPSASVMVTAEADLSSLTSYPAGTIAFTAGFGAMWQKASDGTWTAVGGD